MNLSFCSNDEPPVRKIYLDNINNDWMSNYKSIKNFKVIYGELPNKSHEHIFNSTQKNIIEWFNNQIDYYNNQTLNEPQQLLMHKLLK
jgi:hypothetical protein